MSFAYTGGMHMMGVPPASGGGGGGSEDIDSSDVTYETINLTTGWTLLDPDSMINTVTVNSGVHTFTFNAVADVLPEHTPTNATPKWPRWYRRLSPNGSDCSTNQHLALFSRMSDLTRNFTGSDTFGIYMLHGLHEDPTEITSRSDMKASEFFVQWNSGASANPQFGGICNAQRTAFATGANQNRWFGHVITRPNLHIGVTGWGMKTDDTFVGNGFRQYPSSNPFSTPAVAIYEVVGLAFSNATSDTIAAGDSITMKIMSRGMKLPGS